MDHYLKTIPPFFDHVLKRWKTFEYRRNDRAYEIDDWLYLEEYISDDSGMGDGIYSGRCLKARIKYVLKNFPNLPENYCILGLTDITEVIGRRRPAKIRSL